MKRSPFRRFVRIVLWTMLGSFLFCVACIASLLILPSEARVLRDEVLKSEGLESHTQFQLNLGCGSLSLARGVVGLIHTVDADAKLALSSVRAVAVGVYSVKGDKAGRASGDDLDSRMQSHGWVRILRVHDKGNVVLGYMPKSYSKGDQVPLCLAVRDGDNLVVVSARADVEPLIELVNHKVDLGELRMAHMHKL